MEYACFSKQKNRNSAARAFFDLGSQFSKQRLDISHLDVGADVPRIN